MKRFEKLLSDSTIWYPSDVQKIKANVKELAHLSDKDVQFLYSEYSETMAAGWLILDNDELEHFKQWALYDEDEDE